MTLYDDPYLNRLRRALSCGKPGCPCAFGERLHCPAHQEAHVPNLTIDGPPDFPQFTCGRGCDEEAVIHALSLRALTPPSRILTSTGAIESGLQPLSSITPYPFDWLWPGLVPLGADTRHIYIADLLKPDTQDQDDYYRELRDSDRPASHPALRSLWQSPPPPIPGPPPPPREPTFQEVLDRLASLAQVADAGLIIVDQMELLASSFGIAHNRVLAKLNLLAHRTGAAVVTLCNIPTDSLHAARAYGPIPHSILAAARLSPSVRALLPLSSPAPPIPYRLDNLSIQWGGPLPRASLQALAGHNDSRAALLDAACLLLDSMLAEGPRPAAEIKHAAANLGISFHYLRRACRLRRVRPVRARDPQKGPRGASWFWLLPNHSLSAQPAQPTENHAHAHAS